MDNIWFVSALWIGLALIAASMQVWIAVSVALLEIMIDRCKGHSPAFRLDDGDRSGWIFLRPI